MSAGPTPVVAARLAAALLGVTLLVYADLRTKSWAATELRARGPRTVAGGLARLHYQQNPGGAFAVLRRRPAVPIVSGAAMAAVVLGLLLHRVLRGVSNAPVTVGLVPLLGGTLGNLRDRVDHGYVIDFIEVGRWPVFNVADVCLAVGLTASVAGLIFRPRKGGG